MLDERDQASHAAARRARGRAWRSPPRSRSPCPSARGRGCSRPRARSAPRCPRPRSRTGRSTRRRRSTVAHVEALGLVPCDGALEPVGRLLRRRDACRRRRSARPRGPRTAARTRRRPRARSAGGPAVRCGSRRRGRSTPGHVGDRLADDLDALVDPVPVRPVGQDARPDREPVRRRPCSTGTTRLDALISVEQPLGRPSSAPSRSRNGTTVSSRLPRQLELGDRPRAPRTGSSARSSFSSSASRNASTPCSTSGNQTRRPRKSRESSAEYSAKFGSSSSGGEVLQVRARPTWCASRRLAPSRTTSEPVPYGRNIPLCGSSVIESARSIPRKRSRPRSVSWKKPP